MVHNTKKCIASAAIGTASDGIIPNIGQFGGYCGGRRNTIHVRFDNIQEKLQKREPLLYELGHPGDLEDRLSEMGGRIVDHGLLPEPMEVVEGDLLIAGSGAGGGLGDPIERDPASVKADLDSGLATAWQARNIYCVEATYDSQAKAWRIDPDGTSKLRRDKREERLNRGVPVKEWWTKARDKFAARDMDKRIQEMYRSSATISPAFAEEIKDFWALPHDFVL
jgi:N-methylhydantoinase B/oxoprolinase/acetone carboxylase alpha subunit